MVASKYSPPLRYGVVSDWIVLGEVRRRHDEASAVGQRFAAVKNEAQKRLRANQLENLARQPARAHAANDKQSNASAHNESLPPVTAHLKPSRFDHAPGLLVEW
jgi:hypothetical protein